MRIGARRAAAALLALALLAPAVARASVPNDPEFVASGGMSAPWVRAIRWTPPPPNVGWPMIAVVDSGLASGLDDFQGYLDDQSASCVRGAAREIHSPNEVNDSYGHGTEVATIAAAPANGKGTVGVSPDSQLVVVKFTRANTDFNAVCAFNYLAGIARTGQLVVVNLSFTIDQPTGADKAALRNLISSGALVVAASGNDSHSVHWPASESHVLAVGRDHPEADGPPSSGGTRLDLVAPGAGLRLFHVGEGTWSTGGDAGTSFAAPMVAGVAARVWGTYADVTDPQVIAYLMRKTARRLAGVARRQQGFGMVDLTSATHVPLARVPSTDESEPDDTASTATRSVACRAACKLHGIVSSSDDKFDYWRLARRRCPHGNLRAANHARVRVGCFVDRRSRHATIVVTARPNSQAAYTIAVPRR